MTGDMDITSVMRKSCIQLHLKGRTKAEIIEEMTDLFEQSGVLSDSCLLYTSGRPCLRRKHHCRRYPLENQGGAPAGTGRCGGGGHACHDHQRHPVGKNHRPLLLSKPFQRPYRSLLPNGYSTRKKSGKWYPFPFSFAHRSPLPLFD